MNSLLNYSNVIIRADQTMGRNSKSYKPAQLAGLAFGLALFFVIVIDLPGFGLARNARLAAAVITLMAVWWVSLALPIAVTSLIPIVAFPLLGVMKSGQVVKYYAANNIYLFLGGFIIALAIERWNLHKRLALWMMLRLSGQPSMLVFGFLLVSALLSMWISNTATAMMMLPIGMAVASQVGGADERLGKMFAPALMLAIAYGASVGGIATPIGTPPNIVFAGQFAQQYPDAPAITFFEWAKIFVPLTLILLPLVWLVLTRVIFHFGRTAATDWEIIRHQYRRLGKISKPEIRVLVIFVSTALMWIFRSDITLGSLTIPGWSSLFPHPEMMHDATVAISMAILLFLIPSGEAKKGGMLMDWPTAVKVPWGILILFGGGFAVAGAFTSTGLDQSVGETLRPLISGLGPWVMILVVCLFVTFLTELTSNTATAATLLPIMAAIAIVVRVNPLLLMIPTTISASCAFMLPVATPPNAIVFGSGKVTMGQMVRTGLLLNIVIALVVSTYLYLVLLPAWKMTIALPYWAQ